MLGKISSGDISATGRPIHFMFCSSVGFSVTADLMALFPVRTNPRWRPPPSWKILNGHISATGRPIHFMFGYRVGLSGTADLMALFSIRINSRWRPPTSWIILNGHISASNGSRSTYNYSSHRAVIFAIAQLSCYWLRLRESMTQSVLNFNFIRIVYFRHIMRSTYG